MPRTFSFKPLVSVKDESLKTNLEGNLHLSIENGEGSLTWALLNTSENKYLALESYSYARVGENEVFEHLQQAEWFRNISSVSIASVSEKITLVPEPLLDERTKEAYSKFNFNASGNSLFASKVKSAGCFAVYSLSQETDQLYRSFFAGIKMLHTSIPLLESILTNDRNELNGKAYLNIRSKSIELVITKGGSLLYYNTFFYTTNVDVIYYLLFAFEQLKLNPENMPLQLTGEVDKNDGVYSIIHKYVRNVSFSLRNPRFEYSYRFNELPEHAFYNLFSQYLCV